MQRYTLQIVTGTLPALIPCPEIVADGFARDQAVRIVTRDELVDLGRKATKEKRPPKDVPNYLYLTNLKLLSDAGDRNDLTAARKAAAGIVPNLPISKVQVKENQAGFLRAVIESIAHNTTGDGSQVAFLTAGTVQRCCPTKFVPSNIRALAEWYKRYGTIDNDGRKPPAMRNDPAREAMLCPDLSSALAYLLFFDGMAVCPHCQKLFKKKAGRRQACCSVKCRETHRMARWRDRKKIEAAEKTIKRRGGRQ